MNSPLLPTYARADLAFERGEGPWLMSRDGERYLDFGAGIAVNVLGHAHPHLVAALTEQARNSGTPPTFPQIPEGERWRSASSTRPSPTSSSSPIRAPRRSKRDQDGAQVSLCQRPARALPHPHLRGRLPWPHAGHDRRRRAEEYLEGFGPKVEGFDQVPFGDHEALEARDHARDRRHLIEPIQGEGGIRVVPPDACAACASSATSTACS